MENIEPLLITEKEAAQLLGVSLTFLQHNRLLPEDSPKRIPFLRLGTRMIKYDPLQIRAWIASQGERKHESKPSAPEGAVMIKRRPGRPRKQQSSRP